MKIDNIKEIIKLLGDEVPVGQGYPIFTQSGSFCHLVSSGSELLGLTETITGLGEPVVMFLGRSSISQVMKKLSERPGTTEFLWAINSCPVLSGGYYVIPSKSGNVKGPSGNYHIVRYKGLDSTGSGLERHIILYSGDNSENIEAASSSKDSRADIEPWAINFVTHLYSHMNDIPRVPKFLRDNNGLKDLSRAWVEYVILKYVVPFNVSSLGLFKRLFEIIPVSDRNMEGYDLKVNGVSDVIVSAEKSELADLQGLSEFLKWGPSAVVKLSHMKSSSFPISSSPETWN